MKQKERLLDIKERIEENRDALIAIGDENRQKIIMLLCANKMYGMNVNDITKELDLSRPTVSYHLKLLKNSGLIDSYKSGVNNYYYLANSPEKWESLKSLCSEFQKITKINRNLKYPRKMEK